MMPLHRQRAQERGQQDTAQQAAVQIADDFFQNKSGRGQRRVERRGQTRGRAGRGGGPAVLFRFPGQAGQVGSHGAGQLHAWPFASHARAAADADHAGHKFHPSHAPGNRAEILPKRQFQLRDAAARRHRAKNGEQDANRQRRDQNDCQAAQGERESSIDGKAAESPTL